MSQSNLAKRLLDVIEHDIVPLTARGVKQGNKLFGAAILRKSDLSLVIAETNNEIENPLWHGEMHALKRLYELPRNQIPDPKDSIFLATHEPCSLCLSAITWAGFDNFYYLFSYEDTRDAFSIPHDLNILREVFRLKDGNYNHTNRFWTGTAIRDMVPQDDEPKRSGLNSRIDQLTTIYADLSANYQAHKNGDIPLA